MSRGLLDGSIFLQGPASPDFGVTNWLLNFPHIIISGLALIIGFWWARDSRPPHV